MLSGGREGEVVDDARQTGNPCNQCAFCTGEEIDLFLSRGGESASAYGNSLAVWIDGHSESHTNLIRAGRQPDGPLKLTIASCPNPHRPVLRPCDHKPSGCIYVSAPDWRS